MTDHTSTGGLVLLAYLLGSTPASFLAGRLARGIDLRTKGSGNLGATNAVRVLGWRWAIPVALFDIAKGLVPVLVLPELVDSAGGGVSGVVGLAAILGHVFPVWMRFKGGKGIATTVGVFLALSPLATVLAALVWLVLVLTTRYVSLGSLVAVAALPFLVLFEDARAATPNVAAEAGLHAWLAAGVALLSIWAHRENVARLLAGKENRFGTPRRP